ncbi:hypothetical protein AAZX31_17G190100 [Glycine max]
MTETLARFYSFFLITLFDCFFSWLTIHSCIHFPWSCQKMPFSRRIARLNMNGRKRNDYPFQVHLIIGVLSLLFLLLCLLDDCLHSHYLV